MKQRWQNLIDKVDSLSLRERIIIFVMLAVLILTVFNTVLLGPLLAKQKQLSDRMKADQMQIEQAQLQIRQTVQGQQDPDAANRARLKELRQQLAQMQDQLVDMQKGLVSPGRMTVLLEDILKRDTRLKLVSLKTLPVSNLNDADSESAAAPAKKIPLVSSLQAKLSGDQSDGAVFRHGVEIVVQGTYLDMVQYMDALESMPWQLFWSKAKLQVEKYPTSTLTLTLYTLSLDEKWLDL